MSSSRVRFPAWMSEQTAKVARGTAASFAHSRTDCESRLIEGTMNNTDPPAPTSRSASRSDVNVFPVPQAMIIWPRSPSPKRAVTSVIACSWCA